MGINNIMHGIVLSLEYLPKLNMYLGLLAEVNLKEIYIILYSNILP
jgi:hypothetical protein